MKQIFKTRICIILLMPLMSLGFCSKTFSSNNLLFTKTENFKKRVNSGDYSLIPAAFTENKGQVKDCDGVNHPEVKYVFEQGNLKIFLMATGLAYQFTRVHYPEGYLELMRDNGSLKNMKKILELQKQIRTETYRMDMTLIGASNTTAIITEGKSTDYTNFYNHNVLGVYSFSKITYKDVYPGIDWVIYLKDNTVKYDFVVKPGADPALIMMRFDHQEDISLNKDGSFTIKNSMGSITEQKPLSLQEGRPIATQFVLENQTISFNIENYEKGKTLIIDPAVVWASYYGGNSYDGGYSCSSDAAGNVYLAGYTYSGYGIASGGHQNTIGGVYSDAFLVKFNASGVRLWGSYYGGSGEDNGYSCMTDPSGDVYMSGYTESGSGIASAGHQNTFGGGYADAFLVKFNSSGVRLWGTYYGGVGSDYGYSCTSDAAGNVYLAGATDSGVGIASGGHQNVFGGDADAFLVKFNSLGQRLWCTYYGGSGYDPGRSCTTDVNGDVCLAGYTDSQSDIASGGHQNTYGGQHADAFLVKFSSSGQRLWGTYYGGTATDNGYSCAIDAVGNIYLVGKTESSVSIASSGHQNTYGGGSCDAFLAKFNSSGLRLWATYYGGTGCDYLSSCATDAAGNVYIAGTTDSGFGISSGGHQNIYGGGTLDAFLVKFNGSGIRHWGSYYGGTGTDFGYSCASDAAGNVYLAGSTYSGMDIAFGGHQNTIGGSLDAYLVKFDNSPAQTGIGENSGENTNSYSIYPNPNQGSFVIETSQELEVIMSNTVGQIIREQKIPIGKTNFDMAQLAPGVYVLQIKENGRSNSRKIIKY